MEFNVILAGVGGQGVLSVAYIIASSAMEKGYDVKQSEVHGMSQRGGMVGAGSRYLPLSPDTMKSFIEKLFSAKGEKIVAVNLKAFELGRQHQD